jgi:hypothetical protein
MSDNRAVVDKIRKLLALANGSTEHEAASALAKARAMMDAYGIDDGDVALAEVEEASTRASRAATPSMWENALALTVERALGVMSFYGGGVRTFIGRAPKAEIANYAYSVLHRTLKAQRTHYIATKLKRATLARKRARADVFCEGWAIAVYVKIEALYSAPAPDGLVDRYLAERHPGLVASDARVSKLKAEEDYLRGLSAGNNVDLHMGVGARADQLALPA